MTSEEVRKPKVGMGILIQNNKGEMLLGKRISKGHDGGQWCFPGGHLEFGEKIFDCARREVFEETGLVVSRFELISLADELRLIEITGRHYVNIGVRANYEGGEPKVMEPEKCEEWRWFAPDELPENLFEGTRLMLQNIKTRKIYQP